MQSQEWLVGQHSSNSNYVSEIIVDSTQKKPKELWRSNERLNEDWIKTPQLSGAVLNYSSDAGFRDAIIINNAVGVDQDDIQVYYEPAVTQKVTVCQEDGLNYTYGDSETLFVEGNLKLSVEYLDLQGNSVNQTASMLKADLGAVYVNGRIFNSETEANGIFSYSGTLMMSDSNGEITISNAIGLEGGNLYIPIGVVREPNIELMLEQISSALVLDKNGESNLEVRVWNGKTDRMLDAKDWTDRIHVRCESELFNANTDACVYTDGILTIQVSLKDLEQHSLDETEEFIISVTRDYTDGVREPAGTGNVVCRFKLTSDPPVLEVRPVGGSVKALRKWWYGGKIQLTYFCDGKELTEKQKQNLKVDFVPDDALKDLVFISNRDICFRTQKKGWFQVDSGNYNLNLEISYEKWNSVGNADIQFVLGLSAITPKQKVVICLIILAAVFILACLIWQLNWIFWKSKRSNDYIPYNTPFSLRRRDIDGGAEHSLYWNRLGHFDFLRKRSGKRCAHISRKSRTPVGKLPLHIDLYLSRNIGNNEWKLENIGKIKKGFLSNLYIGDNPVDENNRTFKIIGNDEEMLELRIENEVWQFHINEQ